VIKSSPEADLDELIAQLDVNERRYVFARAGVTTDKEAYEEIGVSYNWLKAHGTERLNAIAAELVKDVGYQAMQELKSNVVKAAKQKTSELDDRDVRIRAQASSEIMDRVLGKPTVNIEQSTSETKDITVTIKRHDD
jgi:hypothetical protein